MKTTTKIQTLTTKGQVLLPLELREALDLQSRNQVMLSLAPDGESIILRKLEDPIKSLRGILKHVKESTLEIKRKFREEEDYYERKKFSH